MDTPRFSVVIPNARAYPARLVGDLMAQADGDEVIVVRNQPARRRDRWIHLDADEPRLLVEPSAMVIASPLGAAAARNSGWQAAQHPWVLFLDDDVHIPADLLDQLRRRIEQVAPRVFALRVRSRPGTWADVIRWTVALDRGDGIRTTGGAALPLADTWQYGVGAALLVHRDVLAETGGFKDELGAGRLHGGAEDLELLWHLSRHTSITYLGDISVQHTDVDTRSDIGRKFRHYGRAIGRLAGTAKGPDGLATAGGYCLNILRATFAPPLLAEHARPTRIALRWQAIRAAAATIRVYGLSLVRHRTSEVLCPTCRTA
jgi:GT2 family glycosyltransferase